jgi:hypothetical protein
MNKRTKTLLEHTKTELYAIEMSVLHARWRRREEASLEGREGRLLRARVKKLSDEKRWQEYVLLELKLTKKKKRDLRNRRKYNVILAALESNDIPFFIKLGRVLGTKLPDETQQSGKPDRLTEFLLDHWAEEHDGLPELFKLNREALVYACEQHLGRKNLTADAVVKCRQRLRLKTTRGRKLAAIRDRKTLRFL